MFKKIVCYKYNDKGRKAYLSCNTQYYCRFCKETKTKINFKTDAHVVSEALGNKYLLSKYECDQCNKKFAECEENEIGKLFKFYKANRGIEGKNGKAKIKKSGLEWSGDYNEACKSYSIAVEATDQACATKSKTIKLQSGDKMQVNLSYTISINFRLVYRALLKYAWGIIPESLTHILEDSFSLLQHDDGETKLELCAFIHKKGERDYEIALYEDTDFCYTRYICLIDVFQYTYIVFLNCKRIAQSELYKCLRYDSDDIYKTIDLDYSSTNYLLKQRDQVTGIVDNKE